MSWYDTHQIKNNNNKCEKPTSLYSTTPKSYHPMPMAKF